MAMEAAEVVMEAVEMAMAAAEMAKAEMGLVDGGGGFGRWQIHRCRASQRLCVPALTLGVKRQQTLRSPVHKPQPLRGCPRSRATVPA
jgi:hypothetical protein